MAKDKKAFPLEVEKMTTTEFKEFLQQVDVALIPVGSTEQHGNNMTMNTDTRLAQEMAKKISVRMFPNLVVLPPINVGVSYHHMDFSGSMTLSPTTLQAVIFDYIKSMKRHGINRFLFINGHGGNQTTLSVSATMARYELDVDVANLFYWNLGYPEIENKDISERYGHACEVEASFGLYLDPSIVKSEQLQRSEMLDYPMRFSELENGHRVDYPYSWKELTSDGSFGDARKASKIFGSEIIELIIDRMEFFIHDFRNKDGIRYDS